MEFQLSYFKSWKMMLWKCCTQDAQQIWETQQWSQDWKRSVFIPIPKKGNAKECSNYCTVTLISHTSKVMHKFLQARLQHYLNRELPDTQAGFRKGRGTREQIANICWIIQRARELQKNIYFCFIDYAKTFDYSDQNKLENSSRNESIRPSYLPPEKSVCRSRRNRIRHGTMDWSQIRKEVYQGCILWSCLSDLYAEYIRQNAGLDEAYAGIRIAGRNINNLRYADDTTLMAENEEELKSLLIKVKEWKSWLKIQHSGNEDHGIWVHHFMANRWGDNGNSDRLYFLGLQNRCRWWLQPWNLKTLAPWKKSYAKPRQSIKKQSHYLANKVCLAKVMFFSSSHVWMWELDHKESLVLKSWCFWTVVLEKILESSLDCKEIQPVHPKGDQSSIFIESMDAEAETPNFWPSDARNQLTGKSSDAGKDWRQEERETTEDEMVGWHHWLNGHESE